jgi:hypothetical protein
MARTPPELPADIAALTGTWKRDDERLARWTLRVGGASYAFVADDESASAIVGALQRLPELFAKLTKERDAAAAERDDLEDALQRAERAPRTPAPVSAPRPAAASTSIADVPLSMIGTFSVSPKLKAAAKKDPLAALVVQIDKAMAPGASELDRARLLAMAAAVGRGDMETFWATGTERSKKKLAATTESPSSTRRR